MSSKGSSTPKGGKIPEGRTIKDKSTANLKKQKETMEKRKESIDKELKHRKA